MPYLGLLIMLLSIFCLIDVITADDSGIRHLPKMVWLLLVIVVPLAGSIAWLVVGRPEGGGIWGGSGAPRTASADPRRDADRGRPLPPTQETAEEYLRRCRERAEEQRRIAREQRSSE
ncbi:PLD nuclease N-terminal domain-containing protein [Rhodococcus sp. KRD162]|uniref:PLD nuclease N-terminal domain-containing protein n=1 Tax=Rhodococcus sp. KRD162 TaxID=2729725 RepID=UPI0019D26C76|nr:PLD nuclease N-terminal domain-containing protein [Rhodococcus sp. KRD162]